MRIPALNRCSHLVYSALAGFCEISKSIIIIKDDRGNSSTPSCVGVDMQGRVVAGYDAYTLPAGHSAKCLKRYAGLGKYMDQAGKIENVSVIESVAAMTTKDVVLGFKTIKGSGGEPDSHIITVTCEYSRSR